MSEEGEARDEREEEEKLIHELSAKRQLEHEAGGVASGALAGVLMGAAAGPAGAVAGVVIGGIAGALAAKAMDATASREAEHERALDAELGVSQGDLGVAPGNRKPTGE